MERFSAMMRYLDENYRKRLFPTLFGSADKDAESSDVGYF